MHPRGRCYFEAGNRFGAGRRHGGASPSPRQGVQSDIDHAATSTAGTLDVAGYVAVREPFFSVDRSEPRN